VKHGKRKLKSVPWEKQIFMCKRCTKSFTYDDGFKRMRHPPEIIVKALYLHHTLNYSLRAVARHLFLNYGVIICPATVSKWVKRKDFETLMNYLYGRL